MTEHRTVYLIDGTAYIHRAFHAIRSLANSKGMPTNAVFGYSRMLISLMDEKKAGSHGGVFRQQRAHLPP
jgi:DNA polymerase-1